jgi:phage host-nuclease inhibitor protein Gam
MRLELDVVDKVLERLGELNTAVRELEAQAEAELAPLRQKWEARLTPLRDELTLLDKVILDTARRHRREFFAAADLVDLRHGFLIYGTRRVVRKSRGVLALLESLQWEEAIKRTAKVRWEVLETWPEARLISCGTERMDQESFAYEIKTPNQITRDVTRRGVASLMSGGGGRYDPAAAGLVAAI